MPKGNGTGPAGMGAMTGRAAGYHTGNPVPGYMNPVPWPWYGIGLGRGRGFWCWGFGGGGRGWRHWYYATGLPGWVRFGWFATPHAYVPPFVKPDPEAEKKALKLQADAFQSTLEQINKRLSELESETASK